MMPRRDFLALAAASGALATTCAKAADAAAQWPQKSVKVVVPYLAGGSADQFGRIAARHMQEALGQPFVVENRGGAGGMVGSQAVAKSAADGYSLLVAGIGSHIVAPLITPGMYDPMQDFTYIAMLGGTPSVLVVNAAVPVSDLKRFMAYAKQQPKGLSWGSSGHGTHGHLIGELFNSLNGLNMQHIAYKGFPIADLLGNQIPASVNTISHLGPHIKSGKLRGLAVTSAQRLENYPDIPTFAELGYPQLTSLTWFGLAGPAGLPDAIVRKANAEARRSVQTPEVRAKFAAEDTVAEDMDATAFTAFVRKELDFWRPHIKQIITSQPS